MKSTKFLVSCGLALASLAFGQLTNAQTSTQSPKMQKAAATLSKIDRLSACKFVLPLLLSKSQMNDILLTLEKCRKAQQDTLDKDADEMAKIDAKVTKALDEAIKDGNYPSKEFQNEVIKVTQGIATRRAIVVGNLVGLLNDTVRKSLNGGQLKAMVNLVDPNSIDSTLKPEKWTEEEKVNFYLRTVMLDNNTYELLKTLYKNARD
jgi:hypothetical protein